MAELKKAFQAQARLYHPDTMHGKAPAAVSAAEARFHRVHEAWTVLQDPSLRAQYDRDNEVATARATVQHTEACPDDAVVEPCPEAPGEFTLTLDCRCGNPLTWHTADLAAGQTLQRCEHCSQATVMPWDDDDDGEDADGEA